jgi:site-specific recombinase XerD
MEYFQAYIRDFLKWLTEQEVSENTKNGYEQDLSSFVKFMEEQYPETKFKTISRYHLDKFFEFSSEVGKNSLKTITRKRFALKKFLIWAYDKELIEKNPGDFIDSPAKSENTPKTIISNEELKEILTVLDKGISKDFINLRRKVQLAFLWHFGATISEIYDLNISDVNVNSGEVTFRSRKKERTVPMNPELNKLVAEYLVLLSQQKTSNAFFSPVRGESEKPSRRNMQRELEKILTYTNIDEKRRKEINCQSIRNTRITTCIDSHRDLMSIMAFFGLDLSSIKPYIGNIESNSFSVFKNDKIFEYSEEF